VQVKSVGELLAALSCVALLACAGREPTRGAASTSRDAATDTAPSTGTPAPAGCRTDSECASGFCDRAQCSAPDEAQAYGTACEPPVRDNQGRVDGKLYTCGAYVCIDGRCRSCASDAQCQAELGSPACLARPNRPGVRCGAATQ